ncbi:putative 5-oxoprolinase, partial [Aureobasidium melanogenum]
MPEAIPRRGLRISIGMIIIAHHQEAPDGKDIVIKILSVDPSNYDDAPTEAIRRVLEVHTGTKIPRNGAMDLSPIGIKLAPHSHCKHDIELIYMTEWVRMGRADGTVDHQRIQRPPDYRSLFCCVEEVSERVVVDSCPESHLRGKKFEYPQSLKTVSTASGESVQIISPLDIDEVEKSLKRIKFAGISSLAVCLMHSYIFPDHELKIREIAERLGFDKVCLSSSVSSRAKIVPRGNSTIIDAYLTPVINRYLSQFSASFPTLNGVRLDFMQSDGGLVPSTRLSGLKAILSGPAGGVVGYAKTCYDGEDVDTLVSSNICLNPTPQVSWFKRLNLTSTPLQLEAVVFSHGRMASSLLKGRSIDFEEKFIELSKTINKESGQSLTWREVAAGFIEVANNAMSGPIRTLTEARGYDTRAHNLASFGGAGGQHACEIAKILGIKRVLIHKYSSVLSAHGIGLADIVEDGEEAYLRRYDAQSINTLEEDLARLARKTEDAIILEGFYGPIESTNYLSMRYDGSDTSIVVPVESGKDTLKIFVDAHQQEFGYTPERDVFIDQIRVRSVGKSNTDSSGSWSRELASYNRLNTVNKSTFLRSVFFPSYGYVEVPIYTLGTLTVGSRVSGPCLIVDETQTVVVIPGAVASILKSLIVIDLPDPERQNISSSVINPVQLSVFKHRFFGVAEQIGRALQKVSISANIKERLDFSCAIFTSEGDLVANAPHVPAMIGSMAFAVKSQVKHWKGRLSDGDVLLHDSHHSSF